MRKHLGIIFAVLIGMTQARAADSHLSIDVKLRPAGTFRAETKKIKGFAYKTDEGGVAAENVLVDLRTLSTGISLRDEHTKKHLDVAKYPIAQMTKASGSGGKGTATIRIKGLTQDVIGTYTVNGETLEAKFPMKLSDLSITGVRYMGVGVADDVMVTIDLPIQAAPKGHGGRKSGSED